MGSTFSSLPLSKQSRAKAQEILGCGFCFSTPAADVLPSGLYSALHFVLSHSLWWAKLFQDSMNTCYWEASLSTQTGLLLVVIERIVTAIDLLNFTSKEMSIFLPLSFERQPCEAIIINMRWYAHCIESLCVLHQRKQNYKGAEFFIFIYIHINQKRIVIS